MRKITKEQKKIIYIALILSFFEFSLWGLIIMPQKKKLTMLQKKLSDTEAQIAEVEQITQGRNMSEVVTGLNKELSDALGKLPSRQEIVIGYLTDNARNLGIIIRNFSLSDKQVIANEVAGYMVTEMPITINLTGEYQAIAEYLNALRDDTALLIRIENIDIKSKGGENVYLDASLQVNAYFTKKVY